MSYTYNPSRAGYIIANHGGPGFFRVKYSSDLLQLILAAIRGDIHSITPADRSTLLNDYFNFLKNGHATPQEALEIAQLLQQETDYTVWGTGLSELSDFGELIELESYYGQFQVSCNSNLCDIRPHKRSDTNFNIDYLHYYLLKSFLLTNY
jgi:hypothetical protein